MKQKTEGGWEERFDERYPHDTLVSAHQDWTYNDLKDFIREELSQTQSQTIERCLECRPKTMSVQKVHDFYKGERIKDQECRFCHRKTCSAYDYSGGMVNGHNQALDDWTDNIKALGDTNNNKK